MENFTEAAIEIIKKLTPVAVLAILGTIVHVHRTKEKTSKWQFIIQTIINIAMVFATGIVCTEVFKIDNEKLVWVLSGIACSFSVYILQLIQVILTDIAPDAARKMFGVDKKDTE